ncbi:uncharacterized protein LOC101747079 [Bombyx mori]|uniref:Uncharacterized protein n=1 Tax=Bombyx mori TaxID=7091 RepID=A0A8R2AI16_BOMMO|nr:uncharacterized protein LOC101747079 [Bombyx mori]
MPCGKRPLVKAWDKPKKLRVVIPSRYEQNEASVKQHWKNVIKSLELSYKDDQFWESQSEVVRQLVGPVIFERISKIFNLPMEKVHYEPKSETASIVPSEEYYKSRSGDDIQIRDTYSMADYDSFIEEDSNEVHEEQSEQWSDSSPLTSSELGKVSRMKSLQTARSKSVIASKTFSKSISFSKVYSRNTIRSQTSKMKNYKSEITLFDEQANSEDDIEVHPSIKRPGQYRRKKNPHFEMLYCNESETDMIKWNSKYKQRAFEVSASDEFSKKAEILTKKISKEFYDWWVSLGNVEFKSEIKRPEDIEDLFQVWFDEHASRGLVLHPKILPCVLKSISEKVGALKSSCPRVLKKQVAYDIKAETSPAHVMAFGTCLPQKMKHIPPKNNTKAIWRGVKIPEDLRSMAYVWEDIQHLTSTKAFHKWLQQKPNLSMPPFLKSLDASGDKKQLFVVPSDFVVKDKSWDTSANDLALPVSQFSIELKEVLSKLMNH